MVEFQIKADSDIPASNQLFNQIRSAIASRQFPPGYRLPSTRQLAKQTGLHRNTISKVYRQLEDIGLVEAIAGKGIYVKAQGDEGSKLTSPTSNKYPDTEMTEITNEIIAQNKVDRFVSRFESSYELLACHVALPLVLTPELVNYLRIEFLKTEKVPWIAEADLLLSNLCRPVGYELYVMDEGVRAYLLQKLAQNERFGQKRIKEIARLLLSYVQHLAKTNPFLGMKELETQKWGAMLYLDTEQTVREIAKAMYERVDRAELARLLKITEDFKQQIASSGQFQDFLDYAQLCSELLREPEKVKLEQIADSYQVAGLELTVPRSVNISILDFLNLDNFESFEFTAKVATIVKLKTILLVEDEQAVIEEVSKNLSSQYGITVRGTDSINEVIQLAESGEIDLILINYGLPNSRYQDIQVNGFETIRILKANSNVSPTLPIVGFSGGNIANDFIASGADGFYSKKELLLNNDYQKFVDYLEEIFAQALENTSSEPGKNYGIAIGINQYNHLPSLRYAVRDAEVIKNYLEQRNFSKVDLFSDVTSVKVKEFLAEKFEQPFLSTEDNLWFFFSGHSRLRQGVDYLMLVDSKTDEITETAISLNSLVEKLFSSGAGKVILYLDMDRLSGDASSTSSYLLPIKNYQGLIVFYACEPNTAAYEIEQLQQGSFTYALQEALSLTQGNLTINQLEKFLSDRVPELNQQNNQQKQTPQTFISTRNLGEWVPFPSDLQVFQYTTPTVNRQGEFIRQNTKLAQYFYQLSDISSEDSEMSIEMVAVPGGTFTMGSPESEKDSRDRERPQHDVTVPPFFMGKYPITQGQWRAIASRTDLKEKEDLDPDPSRFKESYEDIDRWQRPVERVNWHEAVEFCKRLSKLTGKNYRLPSEAEWEYACRAGTTTPFHFGETITTDLANYRGTDYEEMKWSGSYGEGPKGEYREQTTPVGYFDVVNSFGLSDMHGNVWEWCADEWHDNYENAPSDGKPWLDGDNRRSP
ncbi:MAG: SUMF1/EgtB/PvdO family nonheme iron enzyme, partial [Trichodesmium sp.]